MPHALVTRIMKITMTEDQFRQLLEQNNAVRFGQLAQYLDKRFDSLRDDLRADADRIYTTVDDIAKRLDTDVLSRTGVFICRFYWWRPIIRFTASGSRWLKKLLSFMSSVVICFMSSSLSAKSNTSKFSAMRSLCVDLASATILR